MHEELDVQIEIRFLTEHGVPAELMMTVLQGISRVVWRAEREELDEIIKYLSDLPPLVLDAMKYRFENVDRDTSLNIESASRGSVLLFGAAAGLAYWVADKTIGETVKEAWTESSTHARLKSFLKSRVLRKRERILRDLPKILEGAHQISMTPDDSPAPKIVVSVVADESQRVPKPSEIASKRPDA
jgi:hypothetical protein